MNLILSLPASKCAHQHYWSMLTSLCFIMQKRKYCTPAKVTESNDHSSAIWNASPQPQLSGALQRHWIRVIKYKTISPMHSAAPRSQRAHFPVPAAAGGSVPLERREQFPVTSLRKQNYQKFHFFPQWQIPRNWVSRRQLHAIHKKIIHKGQKWGNLNFLRQIKCVESRFTFDWWREMLPSDRRSHWCEYTCMIKYGANAARTIIHRCVAGLFIQLTRESWGERTAPIGSCASCVWVWHFMSSGFSWVTVRPTGAVIIHFFFIHLDRPRLYRNRTKEKAPMNSVFLAH
jgi:hypothetical protein